jgi:hypothetical protein
VCDATGAPFPAAGAYRFLVVDPQGRESECLIEFDPTVRTRLQQARRQPFASGSNFWLVCAERTLANYLWEHDAYPPDGRLVIHHPCLDDFALATSWND